MCSCVGVTSSCDRRLGINCYPDPMPKMTFNSSDSAGKPLSFRSKWKYLTWFLMKELLSQHTA